MSWKVNIRVFSLGSGLRFHCPRADLHTAHPKQRKLVEEYFIKQHQVMVKRF